MTMTTDGSPSLDQFVAQTWDGILDACTRCGRCVEVCPVVPFAPGLAQADPKAVVGGVLEFISSSTPMPADSDTWAKQCNGCGDCIPACPEHINPRQMLMLASSKIATVENGTPDTFRKMARAIRIMVSMQLIPEDVARLLRPPPTRDVDVVFYTGCNPIRTPHVLFNVMTMLDVLDINYEVLGGPSACCGIIQSKWEGDLKKGGRVSEQTLNKFGGYNPEKVLSWCPSCQLHLGETIKGYREVSFDFDHITKFLIEHEEQLVARFKNPVNKRVLVHTHRGMSDIGDNVLRLLRRIPGLTIVDVIEEPGYMCGASGSNKSPELKAHVRADTIRGAKAEGVDATVSLFHACHLQLAAEGHKHDFAVVNFTELLVLALGEEPCTDTVEQFRLIEDWREMVREAEPLLKANGINMDPDELAAVLPEVFTSAEFRGGLCSFAPGS
jgi:Fe-S oxidoreductase